MSDLAMQFVTHARQITHNITDTAPRITYRGMSTFTKWCGECRANYPHIRHEDGTECAVCGTKTNAIQRSTDQ